MVDSQSGERASEAALMRCLLDVSAALSYAHAEVWRTWTSSPITSSFTTKDTSSATGAASRSSTATPRRRRRRGRRSIPLLRGFERRLSPPSTAPTYFHWAHPSTSSPWAPPSPRTAPSTSRFAAASSRASTSPRASTRSSSTPCPRRLPRVPPPAVSTPASAPRSTNSRDVIHRHRDHARVIIRFARARLAIPRAPGDRVIHTPNRGPRRRRRSSSSLVIVRSFGRVAPHTPSRARRRARRRSSRTHAPPSSRVAPSRRRRRRESSSTGTLFRPLEASHASSLMRAALRRCAKHATPRGDATARGAARGRRRRGARVRGHREPEADAAVRLARRSAAGSSSTSRGTRCRYSTKIPSWRRRSTAGARRRCST